MIDDKKIEYAATVASISDTEKGRVREGYVINALADHENGFREGYIEGAKWAINEFLKDLFHPASEVPGNDNGKVLAFSKEFGNRKLYNMNAMLDETTCDTYQEMWEEQVKMYCLSDWIFVDELFELITKGGKNGSA